MAVTKYIEVKNEIARKIRKGELVPGEKLLPSRKLMRVYGVSYATMNKVVSELGDCGLVERKWGKGNYVASPGLERMNVAVTFSSVYQMAHPFMMSVLKGVGRAVEQRNYQMHAYPIYGDRLFDSNENMSLAMMMKLKYITAVVACSAHSYEDMKILQSMGIPVVSICNKYTDAHVGSVMVDEADAARQVAEHVTGLGHHRIKMVMGPAQSYSSRLIRSGSIFRELLLDALAARGVHLKATDVLDTDYQWNNACQTVKQWFCSESRPTAVIFRDDILALEAIKLANSLGLEVPRDLSIISSGDILHDSRLTSVSVPLEEMGEKAVEMIGNVMDGKEVEDSVLPVTLNIRRTCGPVPLARA